MRSPGWEMRLAETIERHRLGRFEWGRYDCSTLIGDTAQALGCVDPFEGSRWSTKFEAIMAMRNAGWRSAREFISATLAPVPVALAQRGDVGFTVEFMPLMCPAVITGAEAVSRDETGWLVLPREMLVEAYRFRFAGAGAMPLHTAA